jgi:ABC-type branched-subunit amino acid transport system substrate-binding protein
VKGKRQVRMVPKSEEWIYPRSLGFLEMYQGILIAADTLVSLGLEVNLHVYDIRSDTVELTRLIRQDKLKEMDLIIGPVYSSNLAIMADYAEKNRIPVVSPVRLMSNNLLEGNPALFMANPTIGVVQDAIAKETGNFSNNNIVFIHNDSAGVDTDVIRFREKIINELSNHLPFNEVRFKELLFYSRSAFGNDSINRLAHSLNPKSDNIVIIASEEDPVISETLQELHTLSKKYPLKVFGYPALMTLDNLEPKFIFELDMLLFSPTWIDYNRMNVKKFNARYRKLFSTEPDEMSYAWLGYDIAYYFMSGLSIHGNRFIEHPEIHNPRLLQSEYMFERTGRKNGYENKKLYRLRYSKEYEVKPENVTVE